MNDYSDLIHSDVKLLIVVTSILTATGFAVIILNKFANRRLKKYSDDEDFDPTNFRFIQRALSVVIVIMGISFSIYLIPGLRHIANSLITGAGILAVVVGFASQQALSNIISGVLIVLTKPYRINDQITIRDTMTGKVEDITLRHTVIRNYENKRIIIPNSVMGNEVVVNANYTENAICKWVEIGIAYTADLKKAREIMKEEILNHPFFIDFRSSKDIREGKDIVPIRVISLGDFSVTLRAWTWAADPGNAFTMNCDLLESIKARFDAEGIEIPYPYRNVIAKNVNPA